MNIMENKNEVSGNKKKAKRGIDQYWINKHRYMELKHFCLQYPIWEKAYNSLGKLINNPDKIERIADKKDTSAICILRECDEAQEFYFQKLTMIERIAFETDEKLSGWLVSAVTTGTTYENLGIPCDKDEYYDRYRKFFWLLNEARG